MHGTIAKATKSIRFSTRSISAAVPADDAEFIINISINSAISAYNLLSTGRDRTILDNILFQGLFAISDAVFAKEKQPLPNDGITTAAHKA